MPPAAPLQRLRPVPHAAVLAAAADPDHRVPPGTNPRTLVVLEREKLATSRPLLGRRYAVAELVHPAVS
ncbi:hypothetical protein [Streptomyces xinghaiensis]|uniref:hypothetical protein n=1 Tax=Streptomyces xinghaiensis TaxID=1038928 RepID=UPI00030D06E4|nr:hypothetical protein [Streptomyces xinghaiensis]MZE80917.1 hypothetical protein [Streptomyces sp. SID5475]